jgi:AcrR family transcriptional regulator
LKGEAQRNVILDVAFEKFRKYGIRRVTLEDIARDLRISKKTIYQHYQDKEALVRACVERMMVEVMPAVERAFKSRQPVAKKMFEVSQAIAVVVRRITPEFIADLKADYSYLWEEIDRRRHEVFANWEKLFVDGIAAGEIRPEIHPKAAMRIMLSVLDNVFVPDVLSKGEFTPAQAFETFFGLLSRGLFTRPVNPPRKDASL